MELPYPFPGQMGLFVHFADVVAAAASPGPRDFSSLKKRSVTKLFVAT